MSEGTRQFRISASDREPRFLLQDRVLIGRLEACDVVLDDPTVSRIHASISFNDGRYILANLSNSNVLSLNGRLLMPSTSDVLTSGDTIQIGPYAIRVAQEGDVFGLSVKLGAAHTSSPEMPQADAPAAPNFESSKPSIDNVLKLFWDKRTRQKEDWGTRLRPTEKPLPGKAMFNWRPTGDLRQTWRIGLFVWAFILIGAIGVLAFYKYPTAYAPKPLSLAHAGSFEVSPIATRSNSDSCTTCHTPNEPIENSCIRCHQASEFHSSNTQAHEEAGITCTVCHQEHQGQNTSLTAQAISSCSECHNDNNSRSYNGKVVRTPHGGSYGYPAESARWKWKGVYSEVALSIPEIGNSATGDADEQAKLSRQFHTIHVGRLRVPSGLDGDSRGLVSCSTCHKTFDPIDRTTPRETCAACRTTSANSATRDSRFQPEGVNCISCHVQHPFSTRRWKEFPTADAAERRHAAIAGRIQEMGTR